MQKLLPILMTGILVIACNPAKLNSGTYVSDRTDSNPSQLPTAFLNVPGDQLVTGKWQSLQNPKLGTIQTGSTLFNNRAFSIYLPECKKDLPVSLEQVGQDLKVQIDSLPACDIAPQSYLLHLAK